MIRPYFSKKALEGAVMTPAAAAKFRKESERVVGFDLAGEDIIVCTGYIHKDGRILIDSFKTKPRCFTCRQRPAIGGKGLGSGLCQECNDQG